MIDTSDEAVARLAENADYNDWPRTAATLRALAAERAALLKARSSWEDDARIWQAGMKRAETERDAAVNDRNQWIANSRENKLIAEATMRERDAARAAALEEAAQLAEELPAPNHIGQSDAHGFCEGSILIAAAIRARLEARP